MSQSKEAVGEANNIGCGQIQRLNKTVVVLTQGRTTLRGHDRGFASKAARLNDL